MLFFHRFLRNIPERHVEIVDLLLTQRLCGHVPDFGEFEAEAFRRQAQANLEVWPAGRADAVDDFKDNARPVLNGAAITVVAPVYLR